MHAKNACSHFNGSTGNLRMAYTLCPSRVVSRCMDGPFPHPTLQPRPNSQPMTSYAQQAMYTLDSTRRHWLARLCPRVLLTWARARAVKVLEGVRESCCHHYRVPLNNSQTGAQASKEPRTTALCGYWSKFPIIRGPIFGFPL